MRFFFFIYLLTLSLNTSAQTSKATTNNSIKTQKLVYSSLEECKKDNKSLPFFTTPSFEFKVIKTLTIKDLNSTEIKKYLLLEPLRTFSKNIPSKEFVADQVKDFSYDDEKFKLNDAYVFVEISNKSEGLKDGESFISSLDLWDFSNLSDNDKQNFISKLPSSSVNPKIKIGRIEGTTCALKNTKENVDLVQKNYLTEIQPFNKSTCIANKWIHRKDFNYLEDDDGSLRFEAKGYTSFMVRLQNSKYISFQSSESPKGNSNIWYNIKSIDCQNGFLEYQASGYEGGGTSLLDLLNGTVIHNTEPSYFFWLQDKKYFLKGVTSGLTYTSPSEDGLSLWDCSQRNIQNSCVKVWGDPEFAKLRYVTKLIRNQKQEAEFKVQVVTKRKWETILNDNHQSLQIANLLVDEYKLDCFLNSPVKCEKKLVNKNAELMDNTDESKAFEHIEDILEEGLE